MSESKFWNSFKVHLTGHWNRIENGDTSPGVPDVNGCVQGMECWIELKRQVSFQIKASQLSWIHKRTKHGGLVFILVRMNNSDIRLYVGEQIQELYHTKLVTQPVYTVDKGYWGDMAIFILEYLLKRDKTNEI